MASRRLRIRQDRWLTLGDVHSELPELIDRPKQQISDIRSALNLISRVGGRPLAELPADPEPLRKLFDEAPWQVHDVTKQRWANVRSLIVGALYDIGVLSMRSRQQICFSPHCQALIERVDDRTIRHGLSRFLRWCSSRNIRPAEITIETFERFGADLIQGSAIRRPRERLHVARRAWNRAVEEVPGWPQLHVPSPEDDRRYALPWEDFPEALQKEIAEYSRSRNSPDLFDDEHRIIKPRTVRQHLDLLRRYASLLVKNGVSATQFVSLPALLNPAIAKRGLLLLVDDAGKSTPKAAATASALCSIGRYIDLSDDQLDQLRRMESRLRQRPFGMTQKNKERLAQLRNPSAMRKFNQLANRIVGELLKNKAPTEDDARRVRFALAVEILQMAPMRVANLAALDLDRHVGNLIEGTNEIQISIPANEVKNQVALEFILPAASARILEVYRRQFRPLLMDSPSSALFPSRAGGAMGSQALARCIRDGIKRELGLTINAHLFRHIGALLFLSKHPGEYETVRRVLGHKSITTTITFYAGMETAQSLRRFDEAVLELREDGRL